MIVPVVDAAERIARLLPLIDDMVGSGIAVITEVQEANVTESQTSRTRTER